MKLANDTGLRGVSAQLCVRIAGHQESCMHLLEKHAAIMDDAHSTMGA